MFSKRNRIVAPILLLLLAVLINACGGEAATSTSAPAASTSTQVYTAAAAPTATTAAAYVVAAEPTATTAAAAAEAAMPDTAQLNPLVDTERDHLSTFALEVDTGSYTQARNYINAGSLPPGDTVRIEEFVNYFNYHYAPPTDGAFAISIDAAPSPYNGGQTEIVRVGVQGKQISAAQRQPAVLTFVIDISGSMDEPNRLPLVKQALRLLVDELREDDQVGIVVFGSAAQTVLEPTSAANRERIISAIDSLHNDGSTNAEAGLRLGYQMAGKYFKNGASNRVILCSDGVANVGATGPDGILAAIRNYASQGIYLTTVGFGMGDFNDYMMEQLADDGNGGYAYVDTLAEARRIFVENLTGTLQVIAKDAKAQVDFNPDVVSNYRLLGYTNRAIADDDFRNDKVDAGEIGANSSATALYEIVRRKDIPGAALTVQVRYADPTSGEVTELHQTLDSSAFGGDFSETAPGFQLAVAAAGFAQDLHGGEQAPTLSQVMDIAERIAPQFANDSEVGELLQLLDATRKLRS